MKQENKHKYLKPLLTILLGIVMIGATGFGVWYWQQNEMNKQKTESDKQISELQKQINELRSDQEGKDTTTVTDETANWKTLSSDLYNFSIKHPGTFVQKTYPATTNTEPSFNFGPPNSPGAESMIKVVINDSKWANVKDFSHWAAGGIISEKETTIAGEKAYFTSAESMGSTVDCYFIIHSGKAYRISFLSKTSSRTSESTSEIIDNSKYQDTFNKMVDTFKFTN